MVSDDDITSDDDAEGLIDCVEDDGAAVELTVDDMDDEIIGVAVAVDAGDDDIAMLADEDGVYSTNIFSSRA
jgi:hypothetical protein